ncbi:MAG: hypothetical protein EAZ28_05715, partial [Oscillatoriales cyanobacterium]
VMLGFLICGGSCIIESGMKRDINSILVRGGGHCLCSRGFNRRGLIAEFLNRQIPNLRIPS